jgi:hypothetical protein
MANGWWGDWRPSLPAHTGNLQATDLIECTSIIGGVPTNTAITGTQIINAASGGSAVWGAITGTLSAQTDLQTELNAKQNKTVLQSISSTTIVTNNTSEVNIISVAIPTTIAYSMLRCSFIVRVVTLGAAAPRTRIRMSTFPNPTNAQLIVATQLATNAVSTTGMVSIYRTMPVIGGVSGTIKALAMTSNANADYGQLAAFDLVSKDFTTQQYLHFTIQNNTLTANTQSYGVLVENL